MFVSNQELRGLLAAISTVSAEQNCRVYVVGGFVRDGLLGHDSADIDIAVSMDALSVAQQVARETGGKYVLLDEANRVARVMVTGEVTRHLDFSSFSGGIEDDLARRDFTINAMAVELHGLICDTISLIDPFCGGADLKAGLLRAVSQDIFHDDAARLLRAVRLAGELKFRIESKTEQLIRNNCKLVRNVAGERVREELLRLLALSHFSGLLHYLDSLGLLLEIIPDLCVMKGVEQPKEHYWDVFEHSLETVATVEFVLREHGWKYGGDALLGVSIWSEEISRYFDAEVSSGSNRRQLLKIGALLHDIAKPATKVIDDTGKMRFLGHAKEGAAAVVDILNRLRFSGKEVRLVENLVYHHLRPAQMSNEGFPTGRAIYRYFRDTESAGLDILFLALADYLATHGPNLNVAEWQQHNLLIGYIWNEHLNQAAKVLPLKLIDGHDLIDLFGLGPGPLVGELLSLVREAQAAGEVNNRDAALEMVRRELEKGHCCCAI